MWYKKNKRIISLFMAMVMLMGVLVSNIQPSYIRAEGDNNISPYVDKDLKDFYIKNGEEKKFIVENKVKKEDNLPELKVGDRVFLDYTWGVKQENISHIAKGKYFQIELPQKYFQKAIAETTNLKIENDGTDVYFATCNIVDEGGKTYFRASLNEPEENYNITDAITDGYLTVSLELKESNNGGGDDINIPTFGNIKITIKETQNGGGTGTPGTPHVPNYKPDTVSTEQTIRKEGGQSWHSEELKWWLHINRNNVKQLKDGKTITMFDPQFECPSSDKDVVVVDDLTQMVVKDENGQDVAKNKYTLTLEPETIKIYLDMLAPTGSGLTEISKAPVSGVNKDVYWESKGVNKFGFTTISESGSADGWAAFETKIKTAEIPTVGIYNNEKIIINFKKIPDDNRTYNRLYGSDWLKKVIDYAVEGYRITPEQADLMKAAYGKHPILHYTVEFRTKFRGLKKGWVVTNKASIDSQKGECNNVVAYAGLEGGAVTKSEKITIAAEKIWKNHKNETITPELSKDKIKITVKNDVGDPEKTFDLIKTGDGWKGQLDEKLPSRKRMGNNEVKNITYTLVEEKVEGYTPNVSGPVYNKDTETDLYTITNTKDTLDIPVEKRWLSFEEGKGPDNIKNVKVELLENGDKKGKELTLNQDNNWKGEFKNLPVKDSNGTAITYTVKEKPVKGYKSNVDPDNSNGSYDVTKGFVVINSKSKINIPVEKKWEGLASGDKKTEVTVELLENGAETGKKLTLNNGNNWKGEFENLDINDGSGDLINYSVKEVLVKGYTTKIDPNDENDITKGFVITNTKIPNITITVDKQWVNKNNKDISNTYKKLPPSIEVELLKKGTNEVLDRKTLTNTGGWEASFKPVPSTDEKGKAIQYEVREKTPVPGFKPQQNPVSVNNNNAVLVNQKQEKKIKISVEKKWLDAQGQPKTDVSDESITVQIIAKDNSGNILNKYSRSLELKKPSWKDSIDLPAETEDGDDISYTVEEKTVPGYLKGEINGGKLSNGNYSFTVTNIEIAKTEIKVEKKWQDSNGGELDKENKYLKAVPSITVKLVQTGATKELNKDNGWSATFKDLPKTKSDGTEIKYSVEETVVPDGFDAVNDTVEAVKGTATIINKLKPKNIDITVTKEWVGINSNQPKVTLKLVRSINYGAFEDVPGKSIDLPHSDSWSYEFKNLPREDKFGNPISYKVIEVEVPKGYAVKYDQANYTVTNTKIPKINIDVKKKWLKQTDNGLEELSINHALIPEQIEVELLANGASMDPVKILTLKKSEGWTGTFKNLDGTDHTMDPIKYTVKETAKQDHFDVAFVADVDNKNKAVIKNIQTKENTAVKISKVWKNEAGNPVAGNTEKKVRFELYYNDNGIEKLVDENILLPTDDNKWEYTVSGLTKYDQEGHPIQYQVREIGVPKGYFKNITGGKDGENFAYTATNQEIPKININVEKRWVDKEDKDGTKLLPKDHKLIPESLEIKLLVNGTAVAYKGQDTVNILKSNNWKYEFTDLYELDESGVPIKYSVEEILPADVQKSFVSEYPTVEVKNKEAVLINKNTDERVSVSVEKKWKDLNDNDITTNSPEKIDLKLVKMVNGQPVDVQPITLPYNGEWKTTIPNLAKYDANGERIDYKVIEKDVPKGYFVQYGTPVIGADSTALSVTNREMPKIEINVAKKWVDKNGVDLPNGNAQIPDSIRVKLLAGGEYTGIEPIELKKSDGWTGKFTELDKKDNLGNDIVYTIEEIMPEKLNETFVVSGKTAPTEANDYKAVITNKNTDEKVRVKIKKVWTDENGNDITASIDNNVKLKMEILKYNEYDEEKGLDYLPYSPVKQNIEISKVTNWSFESDLLPKLDEKGNEIVYSVREVKVPNGYRVYSNLEENDEYNTFTFTMTNQIIPKTKIDVEKRWIDKDNNPLASTYQRIPEKVTVKLLANGHEIKTLDILKANEWKASFTDLPLTDMYHNDITYKVEEVNIPEGFARASTKVNPDNGTVVITNKKVDETVKLNVRKVWLDRNNNPISNANILPQFVKFQLLANGVSKGSFYVYNDKGFVWTSENLAKYDADGKEISYTIKELDGTYGYSLTSINKSSNGLEFTATNTESPYTPPYIPYIPPIIPNEPIPTSPNVPTPPKPNKPNDDVTIEDDDVALADADDDPSDEDEPIDDDLPKANENLPKTHDLLNTFTNTFAVIAVSALGLGIKEISNIRRKKDDEK